MNEVKLVADFKCHTGENPYWLEEEKALFWTDIPNGKIMKYSLESGVSEVIYNGKPVGGFTVEQDGRFLLFMERGQITVWDRVNAPEIVVKEDSSLIKDRFNDVIAQPDGSVLCGIMPNMPENISKLFHLNQKKELSLVMDNLKLANGLGYNKELTSLYFADTRDFKVYHFDYNKETSEISNPKVLIDFHSEPGRPDGLTVDNEGYLWVAETGAGQIVRFSPEGEPVLRVEIPALKVTSVIFGGDDFKTLFITTAGGPDRAENGLDGATFSCFIGEHAQGKPEFRSNIL